MLTSSSAKLAPSLGSSEEGEEAQAWLSWLRADHPPQRLLHFPLPWRWHWDSSARDAAEGGGGQQSAGGQPEGWACVRALLGPSILPNQITRQPRFIRDVWLRPRSDW